MNSTSMNVYRFPKYKFQLDFTGNLSKTVAVQLPVSRNGIQKKHNWVFNWIESNHPQHFQHLFYGNKYNNYCRISLSGTPSKDIKYEKSFYKIELKNNGLLLVEETSDLIGSWYNGLQFEKEFAVPPHGLNNVIVEITLQSYANETTPQTSLKTMLDRGRLTDVVIKTKDGEFPCHKVVLATASDYFDKMFEVDMKENNESVIGWVDIVDSTSVEDLLHFIYTGQTPPNIRNTCLTLLKVAHMCLMDGLKTLCADQLKKVINVKNMGEILNVAVKNECEELQEVAVNFIVKNYDLKKGDSPPPWENLEPVFVKSLAITMLKAMITKKISL